MTENFDVFLSHNSKDKPAVRDLAKALRARGLRVWLDEWELVPGRPWQEALEEVIETTGSSAVLVGKDGLGPWQDKEMRGCLSEFVDRNLPVIPVLLPGAPEVPRLPIFLKGFTWVDLRGGLTEEGLDRLQWGITGKRPERSKLPSNAAAEAATETALAEAQPASAKVSPVPEIEKPAAVAQDQPVQTAQALESILHELADRVSPGSLLNEEKREEASRAETKKPTASRVEVQQGGVYRPTTGWWTKNRLKAGVVATIMLTGLAVSLLLLRERKLAQPLEPSVAVADPEKTLVSEQPASGSLRGEPPGPIAKNSEKRKMDTPVKPAPTPLRIVPSAGSDSPSIKLPVQEKKPSTPSNAPTENIFTATPQPGSLKAGAYALEPGHYGCQDTYNYERHPCTISRDADGSLRLSVSEFMLPFEGILRRDGANYLFDGRTTAEWPWGCGYGADAPFAEVGQMFKKGDGPRSRITRAGFEECRRQPIRFTIKWSNGQWYGWFDWWSYSTQNDWLPDRSAYRIAGFERYDKPEKMRFVIDR